MNDDISFEQFQKRNLLLDVRKQKIACIGCWKVPDIIYFHYGGSMCKKCLQHEYDIREYEDRKIIDPEIIEYGEE